MALMIAEKWSQIALDMLNLQRGTATVQHDTFLSPSPLSISPFCTHVSENVPCKGSHLTPYQLCVRYPDSSWVLHLGMGQNPHFLSHFLPKQLLREAQTIACPKDSLYTQSTQGGMPARSRWICLAGRLHACRLKWLSASSSLFWAIATWIAPHQKSDRHTARLSLFSV